MNFSYNSFKKLVLVLVAGYIFLLPFQQKEFLFIGITIQKKMTCFPLTG